MLPQLQINRNTPVNYWLKEYKWIHKNTNAGINESYTTSIWDFVPNLGKACVFIETLSQFMALLNGTKEFLQHKYSLDAFLEKHSISTATAQEHWRQREGVV